MINGYRNDRVTIEEKEKGDNTSENETIAEITNKTHQFMNEAPLVEEDGSRLCC